MTLQKIFLKRHWQTSATDTAECSAAFYCECIHYSNNCQHVLLFIFVVADALNDAAITAYFCTCLWRPALTECLNQSLLCKTYHRNQTHDTNLQSHVKEHSTQLLAAFGFYFRTNVGNIYGRSWLLSVDNIGRKLSLFYLKLAEAVSSFY